jgi:hypothetical protein
MAAFDSWGTLYWHIITSPLFFLQVLFISVPTLVSKHTTLQHRCVSEKPPQSSRPSSRFVDAELARAVVEFAAVNCAK